MFYKVCLFAVSLLIEVSGHGRMDQPPARNAAWRFGFKTPPNYDDVGLNCGGLTVQHNQNGGRCGICGDSFSSSRDHEIGGKYATGKIVKTYRVGETIDVIIYISSNHLGYMEFRLCAVNDRQTEVTQECLNQNLLKINGNKYMYFVSPNDRDVYLKVKLPDNFSCPQCVLQWRYRAGNNWGTENGRSGLGLGAQEEFWNCADIAIVNNSIMDNSVISEPSYGLTQLITSMYIKTVPNRGKNFQILDSFLTSPNKQLACALRTDEKNQMILHQKIKICLDNCSADGCPNSECFCVWIV